MGVGGKGVSAGDGMAAGVGDTSLAAITKGPCSDDVSVGTSDSCRISVGTVNQGGACVDGKPAPVSLDGKPAPVKIGLAVIPPGDSVVAVGVSTGLKGVARSRPAGGALVDLPKRSTAWYWPAPQPGALAPSGMFTVGVVPVTCCW